MARRPTRRPWEARDGRGKAGLIERHDLVAELERAAGKRVTIISAPAGSGRVSLLRAWAGRSRQDRRIDTSAPKATGCETGNSQVLPRQPQYQVADLLADPRVAGRFGYVMCV
jgi:hypothetical protein